MNNIFVKTEACVERLYQQFLRTPKLIIAVDFDDTIFDFHNYGYTYEPIINLLKNCKEFGFYIVCFTSSAKERYEFIKNYFKNLNIEIDAINSNIVETPYGKDGKIFFNLLLDDRAGLGQSLEILKLTLDKISNSNKITE